LKQEFERLVSQGSLPRAAIRVLAHKYAIAARAVYGIVHGVGQNYG